MGRKERAGYFRLPIRLLPAAALGLLSSMALSSGWVSRIYHDNLEEVKKA